jgi:hypothetical protein
MTTTAVREVSRVQEMKNLAAKLRAEKADKAELEHYWQGAAAEQAGLDHLEEVRGEELRHIIRMDTAIFLEAGIDVSGLPGEAEAILARLAEATREHQEIAPLMQKDGGVSDSENLKRRMAALSGLSGTLHARTESLLAKLPR